MLGTIFELGSCKLRPRGTTRPRFGGWLADSAIGSSAPHDPVASSQRSEIRTSQTMLRRACAKRSSKHRWTSSSRSRTRTSRRILAGLEEQGDATVLRKTSRQAVYDASVSTSIHNERMSDKQSRSCSNHSCITLSHSRSIGGQHGVKL
jgi:hypothetical protein